MADVDPAIAAAEEKAKQAGRAVDDRLKSQQADDRSYIAKLVVRSFIALIAFVFLAIIVGLWHFGAWDPLAEPAKLLLTILGSVMLPVVTLVIGYYFGSK